jgi:hypothetical protein
LIGVGFWFALFDFAKLTAGTSMTDAIRAAASGPLKRVGVVFMMYVC